MEHIKCILCDKHSDQIAIEENGYTGRKCSECGLIYISPRPSLSEILDIYGRENGRRSAESHISAQFSKRLYAKHNLRILTSFVRCGAILEIGAGAGYFLDEARKKGFEPYAIEVNPIKAQFIREELRIPCEETLLTYSTFGEKRFDVVYHCDVISHFYNPISQFEIINEKLKRNGLLVFETGNLGEVKPHYFRRIPGFSYPDHLFFFGTDSLQDLLQRTGFELLKMYKYSILPQLTTVRMLREAVRLVKPGTPPACDQGDRRLSITTNEINRSKSVRQGGPSISFRGKKIIIIGWYYLMYLLRYKIGRISPKVHRPQTMIVVARKRKFKSVNVV